MRGRRSQASLLLLTAVYLLAAVQASPVFFLGPLAALLLVSHPRTGREWFWIVVSLGGIAAWAQLPASLAEQTVRASAVFFIGAFIALTVAGVRSLFARAVFAVAFAALATVGWDVAYHLPFAALQHELITQTWQGWRAFIPDLPAVMPPTVGLLDSGADRAGQIASFLTLCAALYPAWLAILALAGARLAWAWYQRIAHAPLLADAPPFREFRFNDHLIWLLLASIAFALLAPTRAIGLVAGNALVVVAALYALRGTAIVRTALLRASPLFVLLLLLIMLPLFTVVPVGLTLIGIADTWLDFRRRMAPPPGVPS